MNCLIKFKNEILIINIKNEIQKVSNITETDILFIKEVSTLANLFTLSQNIKLKTEEVTLTIIQNAKTTILPANL